MAFLARQKGRGQGLTHFVRSNLTKKFDLKLLENNAKNAQKYNISLQEYSVLK